jgi:hypothetical protein
MPTPEMPVPTVSVEGSEVVLRFKLSDEEVAQRMARRVKRLTGLVKMMAQMDDVFGEGDL